MGPTLAIWNISQVDQHGTGFEQRQRLPVGPVPVDHGRDLVVGADFQKLRQELLAIADIDRMGRIFQSAFLEHDVQLVPIGGVPGIEIDHG